MAWRLDRLTFSFLERFGIGPWQCVDCNQRQMFVERRTDARRDISERGSERVESGEPAAIGNFIRTEQSLVHAGARSSHFSDKYRAGVVQKLLEGQSTVSRVCGELGVSELEIQQWIKAWVVAELRRLSRSEATSTALTTPADLERTIENEPGWPEDLVIESDVVVHPERADGF